MPETDSRMTAVTCDTSASWNRLSPGPRGSSRSKRLTEDLLWKIFVLPVGWDQTPFPLREGNRWRFCVFQSVFGIPLHSKLYEVLMSEIVSPGSSQPCVVHLAGIEGAATLSAQTLLQAEDMFQITQLHYPGHSRLTLEEMADGCVSALAERGKTSAIWLGESFGSALALSIAQRHPHATQGVVLAGGFTKSPTPSRLLLAARMWDSFPDRLRRAYLHKRLYRAVRKQPSRIAESSVDAFMTNGQLEFLSWRLRLLAAFDCRDRLDRIRVPLLYLGGEDDKLVDTQTEARILRETISGARTFLFPGCGHAVLAERGVECLELLNNFVPMAKRAAA